MSTIEMAKARKRLSATWFSFGGLLFAVLFVQTMTNYYKDVGAVWSWFLPNVVPTLSLIVGVLVAEAMGTSTQPQPVDSFIYRLSLALSFVYLLALAAVILYSPVSEQGPFELMKKSSLALGPMQGLVSGVLALFFTKKT